MTRRNTIRPRTAVTISGSALALAALASLGLGSSHREAPFVTENPKVDATDFYMFTSYEPGREDFVTFVANYQPLQDPYGGPNYFALDPDARYEIHVDNDGDAVQDLTFRFSFSTGSKNIALSVGDPGQEVSVPVPLKTVAPIAAGQLGGLNVLEGYRMSVVTRSSPNGTQVFEAGTGVTRFLKPLDNVGEKTIPDYASYADAHVYDIVLPGGAQGRMFVGQRKDPFVVNLGETFDLVNTNPLGPVDGEADDLADKNVTSFVLEIPKSFLTVPGQPVIGAWTTASLRQNRVLKRDPTFAAPALEGGPFVQVSRLSAPLVNEVVIGLPDKNRFNASAPVNDAQFLNYVTHPTLPELLEVLFGVQAPNQFPRNDLVQVFLTGVPGLNDNGAVGEMLRLNTQTPPTPAGAQSNLGVVGGDLAGFPNGRRPGDDVVDVALRAVMGVLLPANVAPDGQLPYTDGALVDDSFFDGTFPYLRDPLPGAPN